MISQKLFVQPHFSNKGALIIMSHNMLLLVSPIIFEYQPVLEPYKKNSKLKNNNIKNITKVEQAVKASAVNSVRENKANTQQTY